MRRRPLLALLLLAHAARAVESDPLPVPASGSRAAAVVAYNDGVALLLSKDHAGAQRLFERALSLHEALPEAHNNLAFSLRMQGSGNFARALEHYARALELDPKLAQAYMYRGALYTQMGELVRARLDLERLKKLDARLAAELDEVIATRGLGSLRSGIAGQYGQ